MNKIECNIDFANLGDTNQEEAQNYAKECEKVLSEQYPDFEVKVLITNNFAQNRVILESIDIFDYNDIQNDVGVILCEVWDKGNWN